MKKNGFWKGFGSGLILTVLIVALGVFAFCEAVTRLVDNMFVSYAFNIVLFGAYALYLVRRERIDVAAMLRSALKRN